MAKSIWLSANYNCSSSWCSASRARYDRAWARLLASTWFPYQIRSCTFWILITGEGRQRGGNFDLCLPCVICESGSCPTAPLTMHFMARPSAYTAQYSGAIYWLSAATQAQSLSRKLSFAHGALLLHGKLSMRKLTMSLPGWGQKSNSHHALSLSHTLTF